MATPQSEVRKLNGHSDGRRKRSAASIARQVRTFARRRREALAAGKPFGRSVPAPRKRAALKAPRKLAGRRSPGVSIDALTYLEHARRRLLRAATADVPGAASTLGLVALAIEALGGDNL